MSDEERKIETLKKYINSQEQKMNDYYKIDEEFYKDEIEQLEFSIKLLRYILNLIEKKSKEIEELKENECVYKDTSSCTKALSFKTYKKLNDIDKKWEDKIKAKIEEIDFMIKEINQGHLQKYTVGELLSAKRFLESLLEKE